MGSESSAEDGLDRCAWCGRRLAENVRHPVRSERDETGTLHLYAFCDPACRRAWGAERA